MGICATSSMRLNKPLFCTKALDVSTLAQIASINRVNACRTSDSDSCGSDSLSKSIVISTADIIRGRTAGRLRTSSSTAVPIMVPVLKSLTSIIWLLPIQQLAASKSANVGITSRHSGSPARCSAFSPSSCTQIAVMQCAMEDNASELRFTASF